LSGNSDLLSHTFTYEYELAGSDMKSLNYLPSRANTTTISALAAPGSFPTPEIQHSATIVQGILNRHALQP
jgi:hypothetical protein